MSHMSTKITSSSSSSCYLNNGRSSHRHKINGLYHLPTIKRLKEINHPRLFLNRNTKYGISRVIIMSQPQASSSPSSDPSSSSSSWKKWIWGFLLTVILPAAGHKGGLLVGLKGKIDQAIETVEHVTEMVEEIAEEAEEILEQVEEKLPGESKLKKALESLDDLAKIAVKEARKAEDIVHKVKDVEEEIEEVLIKVGKSDEKKLTAKQGSSNLIHQDPTQKDD